MIQIIFIIGCIILEIIFTYILFRKYGSRKYHIKINGQRFGKIETILTHLKLKEREICLKYNNGKFELYEKNEDSIIPPVAENQWKVGVYDIQIYEKHHLSLEVILGIGLVAVLCIFFGVILWMPAKTDKPVQDVIALEQTEPHMDDKMIGSTEVVSDKNAEVVEDDDLKENILENEPIEPDKIEEITKAEEQTDDTKELLYDDNMRLKLAQTICAGIRYTLAIDKNGKPLMASLERNAREEFAGWEDLVSVSGMGDIIVGLDSKGEVMITGTKNSKIQNAVKEWHDIIQISAGESFVVALTSEGKLVSVGREEEGQRNVEDWNNIVQIDTMNRTTVGLDIDGELHFAGHHEKELKEEYIKHKDEWSDVVYIDAAGGRAWSEIGHVIGLKADHTIVMLGDEFESADVSIDNLKDKKIDRIACGNYHLLLETDEGELLVIGDAGTLEYPNKAEKEQINTWSEKNISAICAGYYLSMMLTEDGEVFAAGNEHEGQMDANLWKEVKVLEQD